MTETLSARISQASVSQTQIDDTWTMTLRNGDVYNNGDWLELPKEDRRRLLSKHGPGHLAPLAIAAAAVKCKE